MILNQTSNFIMLYFKCCAWKKLVPTEIGEAFLKSTYDACFTDTRLSGQNDFLSRDIIWALEVWCCPCYASGIESLWPTTFIYLQIFHIVGIHLLSYHSGLFCKSTLVRNGSLYKSAIAFSQIFCSLNNCTQN